MLIIENAKEIQNTHTKNTLSKIHKTLTELDYFIRNDLFAICYPIFGLFDVHVLEMLKNTTQSVFYSGKYMSSSGLK